MLSSLKSFVPIAWRPQLRRAYTRFRHFGFSRHCNICGARLHRFVAYGVATADYPVAPDFLCPLCRSKPPHRLTSHYCAIHPEVFVAGGKLVHVAPEAGLGLQLSRWAEAAGMGYRSGDIRDPEERRLDILHLPFADGSVHLFYCCHVLNALQDDLAAMREVFRVLHPEGLAILQVPAFYGGATTLEARTPAERLSIFADELVYRNYTDADYRERLRAAGFLVTSFDACDLPADLVQRLQLKKEVVHLCRKPGASP